MSRLTGGHGHGYGRPARRSWRGWRGLGSNRLRWARELLQVPLHARQDVLVELRGVILDARPLTEAPSSMNFGNFRGIVRERQQSYSRKLQLRSRRLYESTALVQ